MTVSFFDARAQNGRLESELQAAFTRILHSGQFILGTEVERFEAALAELCGVPYALGISSGTDAILLALMALNIRQGDEVLLPSFTFFATAGCVARLGATPVFVDVCPVCFNLDASDTARKITQRTKAIIPVHLFGQCADLDPILELARAHHLAVIEDAAQALGSTYRGQPAGSLGDFGTYSFFPTKNLGAFGDAGALVTTNAELYTRAKILRNHGMEPKYYHAEVGGNFRLDALQAALLQVKLPHLSSYTQSRIKHAQQYTTLLQNIPGVIAARAEDCGCVQDKKIDLSARLILPVAYSHNGAIWNQYTVRVIGAGRRDALRAYLGERGIGSEIYYPRPLHQQGCFSHLAPSNLPVAERLAEEVLSLPIYPELTDEAITRVVDTVAGFFI